MHLTESCFPSTLLPPPSSFVSHPIAKYNAFPGLQSRFPCVIETARTFVLHELSECANRQTVSTGVLDPHTADSTAVTSLAPR